MHEKTWNVEHLAFGIAYYPSPAFKGFVGMNIVRSMYATRENVLKTGIWRNVF